MLKLQQALEERGDDDKLVMDGLHATHIDAERSTAIASNTEWKLLSKLFTRPAAHTAVASSAAKCTYEMLRGVLATD